jgi:hypothetical protein
MALLFERSGHSRLAVREVMMGIPLNDEYSAMVPIPKAAIAAGAQPALSGFGCGRQMGAGTTVVLS